MEFLLIMGIIMSLLPECPFWLEVGQVLINRFNFAFDYVFFFFPHSFQLLTEAKKKNESYNKEASTTA